MAGPPDYVKWKKGQSGNPGGQPRLPLALRAVKEYNSVELRRVISRAFRTTIPDLIKQCELYEDKVDSIDAIIAKSLLVAYEKGDIYKILPLLERLLGKVSEVVENKDPELGPQVIITLPDNGRTAAIETKE